MTEMNNSNRQKRRAGASPDNPPDSRDASLMTNKRRFISNQDAQTQNDSNGPMLTNTTPNPLDILAQAAAYVSRLEEDQKPKRVILQSTPTPDRAIKKFDLVTALVSHVDILLQVTGYLSPQTLLNLYSISAPFHYLMDSHFTTFIMSSTRTWAPGADRYYPWWCYRQLCIEDPALRHARTGSRSVSWEDYKPSRSTSGSSTISASSNGSVTSSIPLQPQVPDPAQEGKIKFEKTRSQTNKYSTAPVPSFRWLKMVSYRESVVREIIGWMAAHGHRLPRLESLDAIKKLWFLLDIPVNGPRISLIHNTIYFNPETLAILQLFFIKLDMLYTNPVHSYGGEASMREMLLSERSLTTLWNYLRGKDGASKLDVLRLWVKHGYKRPSPVRPMDRETQETHDEKKGMDIMGVSPHLVGRWGYECWGLGKVKLMRPDELVLRESVRRRLGLQRMFLPYIGYGYLDSQLRPLPTDVKAEDVVLSLICRKKNQMKKGNEDGKMDVDVKEEDAGSKTQKHDIRSLQTLVMRQLQ